MASPHVAGAAALLLQARPGISPLQIQQRLQNTARPAVFAGSPDAGVLEPVHHQGAGLIHIDDAVQAGAMVTPSSLALGEVESGTVTKTLHISLTDANAAASVNNTDPSGRRRGGDDAVEYTVGHEPALSTGPDTFTPTFSSDYATVTFSRNVVRLGGRNHDDQASITVRIAPPPDGARLFGGYITFTPADGGPVLRVPYAGYNGDYQQIVALTPTPAGFPWLAKVSGTSLVNQPTGAAFTLQGTDVPFILLHLDHQPRTLKMEVFDLQTNQSVGFADIEQFLQRNTTATSIFAFPWDGTVVKREGGPARAIQNGSYRIELSVLKALGDPNNPAHVERWTSPDIVIIRP
jgi:hypothetical protein